MLATLPHNRSFPFTTAPPPSRLEVKHSHSLDLPLPPPMPHAVLPESSLPHPLSISNPPPHSASKVHVASMQLPAPHIFANGPHRQAYVPPVDFLRTDSSRLLTPPAEGAMPAASRISSSAVGEAARADFNYSLPALGAVRQAREPSPVRLRQLQQAQPDMAPRKKWTISPNLQIPDTIETPQDGLPSLAAEITCLFWFESSSTLKQVLDPSSSGLPTRALVPDAMPTMGFRKWVATILSTTQVAQNVILLALLFVYKLKLTNPSVKGKPGSEYRLLTVALMLGNKFLDDNTYTNKTWAEVSGISVQEVHIMEVEFLSNMRYSLFTSESKWMEWHTLLGQFGTFFHRAARLTSPAGTPRSLVPSPTSMKHVSPKNALLYSPAHAHVMGTPLFPSQASTVSSSLGQLPELGPLSQRKRSSDDTAEPPPKRMAHGFAPGPYSNAPLVAPMQPHAQRPYDPPPSLHKLPSLPSLSIPTPQSNPPQQLKNWSDLSLPTPGTRSMATVFPAPVAWPSTSIPISSGPSFPLLTPTVADASRQMSPYTTSAASSPHGVFAPGSQRQMSPSYFLNQRQSPYRPVRGVQTLLVPPPTTSMYDAARNVAYEQIQYQPLGRPTTERRMGPLPCADYGAWAGASPFHQQPIPQPPVFR